MSAIEFVKDLGFYNRYKNQIYVDYKKRNVYPLALIWKGNPSKYSTYIRTGTGYTTSSTEVSENESMGDILEGSLKYFNYAGSGEFTGTVNTSYLSLNSTEYTPFKSPLGTEYGIQGLFEGVDSNNAYGRIVIDNFKTSDISTTQNLILTYSDTAILWIEATTGLVKASDGTATVESSSGIFINTNYKIELLWDGDYFWISLNNIYGSVAAFAGSFPSIGTTIKYSEDGIYHTVRNVYFSDKLDGHLDTIIRDNLYDPITNELDESITL